MPLWLLIMIINFTVACRFTNFNFRNCLWRFFHIHCFRIYLIFQISCDCLVSIFMHSSSWKYSFHLSFISVFSVNADSSLCFFFGVSFLRDFNSFLFHLLLFSIWFPKLNPGTRFASATNRFSSNLCSSCLLWAVVACLHRYLSFSCLLSSFKLLNFPIPSTCLFYRFLYYSSFAYFLSYTDVFFFLRIPFRDFIFLDTCYDVFMFHFSYSSNYSVVIACLIDNILFLNILTIGLSYYNVIQFTIPCNFPMYLYPR